MALLFQRDSLLTRMGDTSDLDQQIEQLRKCEVIKESDVKILCAKAREILGKEKNIMMFTLLLQCNFLSS